MGHFVLTTRFTAGDVLPFLRLGRALHERGHEVTLVSHARYRDEAMGSGIRLVPLETDEAYQALLADGKLFDTPGGFAEMYRRHVLPTTPTEIDAILSDSRPGETVLVARCGPALGARVAAEVAGLPLVSVYLGPGYVSPPSAVATLVGGALGQDLAALRSRYRLPPVEQVGPWVGAANENVGLWPEWFAPPQVGWPPGMLLAGFLVDPSSGSDDLPAAVLELLGAPRKPVLISTGSGRFFHEAAIGACLEACASLGRSAILVTPHRDLVPVELPAEVFWFERLRFADLMPSVAAVIHHGGIGTACQALCAGVPQVVIGTGGDRPDNARRLVRLGVGRFVPPARATAAAIRDALAALVDNPTVASSCEAAALRMRDSRGTEGASRVLEAVSPRESFAIAVEKMKRTSQSGNRHH